ncbi:uncharacterized protein [Periplaneta americana]|uniref:uncharacterized protein isoform X2 n=1 Tax=Periplaneta americana TaxID=6978 RepID=UPI0037E8D0DC
MDNVQKTFPQVAFTDRQEARLKNVQRDVYLCVTGGDAGYQVSTKTLQADNLADPELLFSLYYFTDAEAEETKMVLPVHHSTNVCLSMDENKMFQLSSLREQAAPYEVIPLEDPSRLMTADERFFYLKTSGTNVALEAMNGLAGPGGTRVLFLEAGRNQGTFMIFI